MTSNDLTCIELAGLVTDYLEGALPPAERERFEAHLQTCPRCARYLEQFRTTTAPLRELREESIPAPPLDDLLQVFREWKRAGNGDRPRGSG
ncbi:MAG: anti-sigma factor family protein [Egibacteraceae bacterium]